MKHTIRIALLVGTGLGLLNAAAQQDPMYTMYMWNMMMVNPGYAGSADVLNTTGLVRRQWSGFDGAPTTSTLMAHTPLRNRSIGTGISFMDDRIGPSRTCGVFGDIAYRIRTTKRTRLAFGLKAGFSSIRMNMSDVPGTDPGDPVYQQDLSSGLRPNFGFGMYYWSHEAYLGISTPKLLRNELTRAGESGEVRLHTERSHFFLVGGYVFLLSEDVRFRPSFLVKAVEGAPLSGDLSANFLFMEKLWAGLAYRSGKEASVIASFQIDPQLRAGYAYDMQFSALRAGQSGSHELMVSYDFSFSKKLLRSPRYF